MSESNESIIWKIIALAGSAAGMCWAIAKYMLTGKKKESYEGEKIKEEASGIRFDYYQKELEYFRQQVAELRTENRELKQNDLAQRQKISEQDDRIEQLQQRIENLQIELTTKNIEVNRFK